MINDINQQKPTKTNQITSTKPNRPKTESTLTGYIAGSFNGGFNRTIAWKQVMAGEKHKEYRIALNMQMLTPLTPAYQKLKCTLRAYFVPNKRVWKNAEKYTAQKGGLTEEKIKEIPNFGGKTIPTIYVQDEGTLTTICNTTIWRDTMISSYMPRTGLYGIVDDESYINYTLPKDSALKVRGRIAIYNDFERHKEYETPYPEYDDDTVSDEEWYSYMPNMGNIDVLMMRGRKQDSYFTNYRTEIQGFESEMPTENTTKNLIEWAQWESKIAEARAQAENAQKNDWDIIAEIRGSKKLSEGKVQLIGEKTFDINYSAITQNTYNNNEEISEEFRVMGKQGAYSYTDVNVPVYAGIEFNEEGYVHIIAQVTADTVYENVFDRLEINVTPLDQYRPDLIGDKLDNLYECEISTNNRGTNDSGEPYKVVGFKRKYSEYFKLPNIIGGDMSTENFLEVNFPNDDLDDGTVTKELTEIITKKTYQFFEREATQIIYMNPDEVHGNEKYEFKNKKIWKDYTDLMINKNQAIKNKVESISNTPSWTEGALAQEFRVMGENQIFFVGTCCCLADLPINQDIKDNFTTWGEH